MIANNSKHNLDTPIYLFKVHFDNYLNTHIC